MISQNVDSINHSLLLRKMSKYGFRGIEQTWFKSYLNSRKQKVNLNGQQSSFLLITDDVPQGSVLGPLLFLLFINDISNFTTDVCSLNLFADDSISYVAAHITSVNYKWSYKNVSIVYHNGTSRIGSRSMLVNVKWWFWVQVQGWK